MRGGGFTPRPLQKIEGHTTATSLSWPGGDYMPSQHEDPDPLPEVKKITDAFHDLVDGKRILREATRTRSPEPYGPM